eukprot:s168_g32.t1
MPSGLIRQTARIGEGLQVGAVTHRAALPPLLPFNLEPNEHFAQALQRAQQPLPHEDNPIADADLRFAADAYLPGTSSLRTWRQQAVGTLRELKRRWKGVTLHLCHFQEPALHQVVKQRDIGLLALLMILTSWADTSLPYGLVKGLPAVGYAPPYGIFPQQGATLLTMEDVLLGWEAHNQHILSSLKPGKDDVFLLQQSLEDSNNGFCKQRVIDNGDTGGQSDRSADANKLTLCSALRPAQHITLAMQTWDTEAVAPCENPELLDTIAVGNDTRCFSQSHEFFIQPTDFDIGFLDYVEDASKTVWLDYGDPTRMIEELENSSWLTKDTNHWQITVVTYNPDYDILTVTGIHFLLARSGRIWKQITFMSLKTRPYANLWSLAWEILFFGSIVTIFFEEVYEVVTGIIAARNGGKCRPMQFIREYLGIWNAVDWVSIIIAFTLLGMWIHTCLDRQNLEELVTILTNTCYSQNANLCQDLQGKQSEAQRELIRGEDAEMAIALRNVDATRRNISSIFILEPTELEIVREPYVLSC